MWTCLRKEGMILDISEIKWTKLVDMSETTGNETVTSLV